MNSSLSAKSHPLTEQQLLQTMSRYGVALLPNMFTADGGFEQILKNFFKTTRRYSTASAASGRAPSDAQPQHQGQRR